MPAANIDSMHAVWHCTFAQGITLTNGISDDWDPRFDPGYDAGLTSSTRTCFWHPGPGGSLNFHYIGETGYHRFKMAFNLDAPRTANITIGGSRSDDAAGGYIQVKVNGKINEYSLNSPGAGTVHYNTSVQLKAGRNEIVVCKQYYPHAVLLNGTLFDRYTGSAVDLQQEPAFRL